MPDLTDWTLHGTVPDGRRVVLPVAVPGCALHDLVRGGVEPDPRTGDREPGARWVGHQSWEYRTTVTIDDPEAQYAVEFDGLDTFATVRWDDHLLGATRNMHRRYRFEPGELATPGEHEIAVSFAPPETEASAAQQRLGARPNSYGRPFEAVRKAAYTFGWDWGPDFPSAGIHRAARLVAWTGARLGDVRFHTKRAGHDESTADIWSVEVDVDLEAEDVVSVQAELAGGRAEVTAAAGVDTVSLRFDVDDPELWWPHSHGAPVLHDLRVDVVGGDGQVLAERRLRVGFREIVLDTSLDVVGRAFGFRVNGVPVFVRGLNWIPDSCFPGIATDVNARLDDAVDAHQNLIRVWGGGFFESDAFYAACDERGLLVWQDFLFACAAYAEDAELADEVTAEARDNVSRLQHHASLALWNGNNENLWGFEEWWSDDEIGGRSWGLGYYTDLLPQVVTELDPGRPYWPGSPASGPAFPGVTEAGEPIAANADAYGCRHLWTEWNDVDHEHYLTHRPRFVSEFGYQAPPGWSTMVDCLGGAPTGPDDQALAVHQKAEGGMAKLERGLRAHGGRTHDMDDWWWRTQHLQAAAVRLGVGHLRALMPLCQGAIWWQLNDCWPVISWAVVDSAGVRKPAWFALRETSADRIVTILGGSPDGSPTEVGVVNDTAEPWSGMLVVEGHRLSDGRVQSIEHPVTLAPRSAVRILVTNAAGEVLRARLGEVISPVWFSEQDRDRLPEPEWDVDCEQDEDGWRLTVTARSLVVDLTIFPDRLDAAAWVDDALVSLFPGEEHTFTIRGACDVDPEVFTGKPVLRAVADQRRVSR